MAAAVSWPSADLQGEQNEKKVWLDGSSCFHWLLLNGKWPPLKLMQIISRDVTNCKAPYVLWRINLTLLTNDVGFWLWIPPFSHTDGFKMAERPANQMSLKTFFRSVSHWSDDAIIIDVLTITSVSTRFQSISWDDHIVVESVVLFSLSLIWRCIVDDIFKFASKTGSVSTKPTLPLFFTLKCLVSKRPNIDSKKNQWTCLIERQSNYSAYNAEWTFGTDSIFNLKWS